ncbi:hypothetical protein SLG_18050 [Sphingobium sp. SYK-6]|uniref:gamma-glutamylcyclotransferase family protein n=1 Tax=Sphingobium sp. (strain NBRC 103272 / SYK-6) TaxID=627192 RepID=UPI00022772AB|nr:gamma-glutamylcyclotransferase family protein [Sphingobium sp. SYK-6]BAK66480.1 hypothetical protein SLG_18050 [Sphingobium sp. SYK-6]
MNSPFRLFTYGQLMPGGTGYQTLGLEHRTRHLGPDRVAGRLYHLGDYPGLITGAHGIVQGEVLEFEEPGLIEEIDLYELYDPENPVGSEYRRIEVDLLDSPRRVWTYEYNRTVRDRPIIATGNWRMR